VADIGIAAFIMFISPRPRCIYHTIVDDKNVEIIHSPQGAFGKNLLTVKENGETVGKTEMILKIKKVQNIDFIADSIILYSLASVGRNPDTTVIHRLKEKNAGP